jgi:hypothetical protein
VGKGSIVGLIELSTRTTASEKDVVAARHANRFHRILLPRNFCLPPLGFDRCGGLIACVECWRAQGVAIW